MKARTETGDRIILLLLRMALMLQILVAISQGQPFVNIHPEVSIKADTLPWEDFWLLNSLDPTEGELL